MEFTRNPPPLAVFLCGSLWKYLKFQKVRLQRFPICIPLRKISYFPKRNIGKLNSSKSQTFPKGFGNQIPPSVKIDFSTGCFMKIFDFRRYPDKNFKKYSSAAERKDVNLDVNNDGTSLGGVSKFFNFENSNSFASSEKNSVSLKTNVKVSQTKRMMNILLVVHH